MDKFDAARGEAVSEETCRWVACSTYAFYAGVLTSSLIFDLVRQSFGVLRHQSDQSAASRDVAGLRASGRASGTVG